MKRRIWIAVLMILLLMLCAESASAASVCEHSTWENPVFTWAEDGKSATATSNCASCGQIETVNCQVTLVEETYWSTSRTGYYKYQATCTFGSQSFSSEKKINKPCPHTWMFDGYRWSADYTSCTASRHCDEPSNCGAQETSKATISVQKVNPTCNTDGSITYTAVFPDSWAKEQKKVVTIEADPTAHDYQESETGNGKTVYTCIYCGDSYTVTEEVCTYGQWYPVSDGLHQAFCRNGCGAWATVSCEVFTYTIGEDQVSICPVCGAVSDGSRLSLIYGVQTYTEKWPYGEMVVRQSEIENGTLLMTFAFENGGELTQSTKPVKLILPSRIFAGYKAAILSADGTETDLEWTDDGKNVSFTLNFTTEDSETPVILLHLTPEG